MLTGRESLLAGGGMVLLSSSIALRRTASGSTSALCLGVSLEVSDPLLLEKLFLDSSSSFVSSAIAAPGPASLDGFLENWGSRLLRFARRFASASLPQAALAIEKCARLFIGPWRDVSYRCSSSQTRRLTSIIDAGRLRPCRAGRRLLCDMAVTETHALSCRSQRVVWCCAGGE